MEGAQREMMSTLLGAVYARGLLSKTAYMNAVDLVYSAPDIPPLFRYPVCLTKEAEPCEYSENTQ